MKRLFKGLVLLTGVFGCSASMAGNLWKSVDLQNAPSQQLQVFHPKKYSVYKLDETTLKLQLLSLSTDPTQAQIVTLPMPDGSTRDFKVWQTPMLPESLAAQFPGINTFTAEAVNNPTVTAKLDITLYGFHAMVFDAEKTYMVDPYDNYNDGYYMVHYKGDETRTVSQRMKCVHKGHDENGPAGESMDIEQKNLPKLAHRTVNGYQLRTYRLALGCSHQYAQAATGLSSPTVAQTFSKMTTTINRVNGVYEREFSVTMVFAANENSLIFPVTTGDPYGPDDSNPNNLLTDNQTECDALIGNANYDIGHVFSTGGGGLALLGVVCEAGYKAQGVTGSSTPTGDGYDIDYVAHEMGHEFGADHTFNDGANGSCAGNAVDYDAYEPGSGSTIMAYAGICDPDDIQPHSDPYFHAKSLNEIHDYITSNGDVCPVKTATGNKLVNAPAFTTSYSIPYQTPFELLAPTAVDSVADSVVLYCWEEYDLGDFQATFSATHNNGPIFRTFNPTTSRLRIFPTMSMVLSGVLSNAGTENAQGEKVPDVARDLVFKCTFRDIIHNHGCFVFPDDSITLHAINTGAGFKVTSQSTSGITYAGHSSQTVTWNVVGTTAAPISAANVDIYMSLDGGNTWMYHVGTFPNTGTASITVPNPAANSSTVRFKVKGSGNVFFNVNSTNFTVTYNSGFPISTGVTQVNTLANDTKIFPVPATDILHISTGTNNNIQATIINAVGQTVWSGQINGQVDLSVASWAKGVYHTRLFNADSNEQVVRSFIVQ